jgi:hypothetical protein
MWLTAAECAQLVATRLHWVPPPNRWGTTGLQEEAGRIPLAALARNPSATFKLQLRPVTPDSTKSRMTLSRAVTASIILRHSRAGQSPSGCGLIDPPTAAAETDEETTQNGRLMTANLLRDGRSSDAHVQIQFV